MDSGSPVLLDFSFPFSADSPQNVEGASTQSNASSSVQGAARRTTSTSMGGPRTFPRQHRTSIDSMLDQNTGTQWSEGVSHQAQRHGSTTSLSNDVTGSAQEKDQADDDRPPTWSELKTKAGKERKRLPLACIACRRKKIKCSGEKPACKHCMRARVPCVYKVTTRKAAPRTDYMAMLDKRLKRMEDRVIKMIPKEDLPDFNATGRASVRPPLPGQQIKKEKSATNKRSAEEAFTSELGEWTRARRPVNVLDKAARTRDRREADNKLSTDGAEALPPQHIQEHLAEIFFDCVYGQSYLLLHKPSFMRKLNGGTVPPVLILAVCAVSARFSTHPQVNTEPAFLRGEQWATPARLIAEKRHFEPNVTILTVMLILGLHYFGTCEGGLSWSFGGQAMRMGYALQLHRELDHDPLGQAQVERAAASGKAAPQLQELSFTDREIRRRLMWACYLMDTFNSSGTERPSFLNEDYMKIQLPIRESHFQLEMPGLTEDIAGHIPLTTESSISAEKTQAEARANMGVAAYVVRAVVIWKRIVQYLNLGGKEKDSKPIWDPLSQFSSLQRQIIQLDSNLPENLRYTPENLAIHVTKRLANQYLFLHVVIAQTSLFLHRFAIPTAPNVHRPYAPNTPKSFLASSAATVVEAATQVSRIVSDSTGHTLTVPFAGYCAYAAATVHVWGIFSRNAGLEASSKENLRHNYRYLTRMKRFWGMFHYMAESVKDIYRAFADAAARRMQIFNSQRTITTASGDTQAAIDSIAMSVEPSRSTTPTRDPDAQASNQPDDETTATSDPTKSPSAHRQSASGKPMFQYGDWFDKYPHGVSEAEWETSHLPHRKETQKGTEAVMSQQSELQSVEEFFASLSPPSKGDGGEGILAGQRGRKVPRKRGKSVADNALGTPSSSATSGSVAKMKDVQMQIQMQQRQPQQAPGQTPTLLASQKQIQTAQQHRHSGSSLTAIAPEVISNTSDIDIPMSEFPSSQQQQPLQSQASSAFELSSDLFMDPIFQALSGTPQQQQPAQHQGSYAFSIDSPVTPSNSGSVIGAHQQQQQQQQQSSSSNPQMNFNFNYTSALPHLDRQMVFGAYAGIDQANSNNSSALNNPNNLDFWNNPWESIDMDGFTGFADPYSVTNSGPGITGPVMGTTGNVQNGGTGNGTINNSSAWFMPFNIEPPDYGMEDLTFAGIEAMNVSGDGSGSSNGNGGGNRASRGGGSFSGMSNPPS